MGKYYWHIYTTVSIQEWHESSLCNTKHLIDYVARTYGVQFFIIILKFQQGIPIEKLDYSLNDYNARST